MSGDSVRRLALDALLRAGEGEPLDPALDAAFARLADPRGRGLLAELVKGAVRWRGRYDWVIEHFSQRRGARRPAALQQLLRLSLHQLLACAGVPAYAAVHEAVALCRARVSPRQAPYVNALLQSVLRETGGATGPTALAALRPLFPDPGREPAAHLVAWQSHPRWLVERWLARFGFAATETLCAHNNRPAPLTLHVLSPHLPEAALARLAAAGHPALAGRLAPRALRLETGPDRAGLRRLLAAEPGLIVQDEGAQAATAWLAAGAGGRLLDLCAAPGGKTFHLRAVWPDPAAIVAMDRGAARLALLVETAKRLEGPPPAMILADGESPPFRAGVFDTVLLDGPCSGTGVLRHHPEGRWRLKGRQLAENGARLASLARAAAALLAPEGRLLYATCSLEPEENEEVVDALVTPGAGAGLLPDPDAAGNWQRRWLPQETGTDGFFAARLRRREAMP
jgi:16S rRNA (cytosine967-C5)-methyltransferase